MAIESAANQPRFSQQIKKGVLEMLVLQLLAAHPSHGYELLLRLKNSSGGLLELKEGTLYPILYRLEDDGAITSAWKNLAEQAPEKARPVPRKVYTITAAGRQTLQQQHQIWHDFVTCVEEFCRREQT